MRIVCAVEGEQYARHCATMLHSLLVLHEAADVQIDYLHGDDTSVRGRKRLGGMVDGLGGAIAFHRVEERWLRRLPVKGFTGKATWYRLFLDEILPDAARVLYLDTDLIVLGPLTELWKTDLQDAVLGAVTNVPPDHYRAYTERPEMEGGVYFNAGVLLLDLKALRDERLGAELRAFALRHADRLQWRDQDVLNEVLHSRRLPLHPRWNCMNSIMSFSFADRYFSETELDEARRAPAIRHFEGPASNKPWHLLCDPTSHAQYLRHRRQTPWPRMRRRGGSPPNLLRYARRRLK